MSPATMEALSAEAHQELVSNILPFWRQRTVDQERGGFISELSNDLVPNPDAGKGLILNARILWTFSAVWRLTKADVDRALADRAQRYLLDHFRDPEFGGFFWELSPLGVPTDTSKKIYGQAFCLYALSEHHRSFASPESLDAAIAAFHSIEGHSRDPEHGGYLETLSRDWKVPTDLRLSDKDLNEPKSMNNHLHVLEAYANLCRVWSNDLVRQRLRELLELFRAKILNAQGTHLNHFFDRAWNVRSDSYTYGHDIEASWLLCEAAEVLGESELIASTRAIALRLAEAVAGQAFDSDGGMFYEGRNGQVIGFDKEWWPQAEAVVGLVNAYGITGNREYLDLALGCWNFIQAKLVDRQNGEWFWRVSRAGVPDLSLPKVSMWKCPYHNARCCLEIINRTE